MCSHYTHATTSTSMSTSKRRKKSHPTASPPSSVKCFVDLTNEDSDLPSLPSSSVSLEDVPDELMLHVLQNLATELKTVCKLQLVCKRWKRLFDDPVIWKKLCKQYGYQRQETSWKELFMFRYTKTCIDCGKETKDKIYGGIQVRLCDQCREAYLHFLPHQKFVAKNRAKEVYGLNNAELSTLQYGYCGNPMDPRWNPMNLFWKHEIETLAKNKYGSLDNLKAIKRRRMIDRELKK